MDQYHFLFKCIIVGDTSVGKSCILLNYTEKKFNEEHDATNGVEFGSQLVKIDDKTFKIQIWDTAGQLSFRCITMSYYRGYNGRQLRSIGVVLVFDLTKKETFQNVVKWYNFISDCIPEFVEICLVGNKLDLEHDRQVTTAEAQEFAQEHKWYYYETSAKTGQNVEKVFEHIAQRISVKIDQKIIDLKQEVDGIKLGPYFQNAKTITNTSIKLDTGKQEPKKKDCC